ncbi:MAG: cyclic nucleotide-binding domain-containing protein [Alphaproteobacteria bacterium]|nr:cyclic nucleotide-binding domain-containing protein [Alphaproteobacteria bacterium]
MPTASYGAEIALQLRMVPLFASVSTPDLAALLADAVIEDREAGAVLLRAGEPACDFFVLLSGHVRLTAETGGRSETVEILGAPALFGEAAVFDHGPNPVGAEALDAARLLRVPGAGFVARLEPRFDLILSMLGGISFRLRVLVRQIAELKLKTTAQRLGGFLLTLTEASDGSVELRLPYDKRLVAEKLGMKPESLSRALARLAPVGVKSCPDGVVAVADVARLRRFSLEEDLA